MSDSSVKTQKVQCKYCSKDISYKNMAIHLKRCKVKKANDGEFEIENLLQKIKILESNNSSLQSQVTSTKAELEVKNSEYNALKFAHEALLKEIIIIKTT